MNDEFYMQLALNEAWRYQGLTYPNPAVGAVITCKGEIVAIAAHQKAGSSHAEVLALLTAYETLSKKLIDFDRNDAKKAHQFLLTLPAHFFKACSIYVTLEPCSHKGKTPSCASLLRNLALQRVVIGTKDPIEGHGGGMEMLGASVSVGVLEEACKALIEPFLIWQKRAFVLFKLAQTTNARIGADDRYLSCPASLEHVHRLRGFCDILLIGGNTVRVDRPTLDCRLIQAKASHVKIYAKEDNFDRGIPLFGVQNREVEVVQNLDFLDTPSFVLAEGGEGMLDALKEKIDWLLIYQTPKLSTHNLTYNTGMNLTFLHHTQNDVDLILWSKRSEQ